MSGDFGKISMGSVDNAAAGGVADVGLSGVGADDAESVYRSSSASIRYDGTFGAFGLAVSVKPRGSAAAFSAPVSAGDTPIVLMSSTALAAAATAHAKASAAADDQWGFMTSYAMEPISFSVGMDSNDVMSSGLSYTAGDLSGNFSYRMRKADTALAKRARTLLPNDPDDATAAQQIANAEQLAANKYDAASARKGSAMGADLTFTSGDMKITVAYSKCSAGPALPFEHSASATADADLTAANNYESNRGGCAGTALAPAVGISSGFGIGMALDLGGGATLKAGVGSRKGMNNVKTTLADVGIAMAF